MKQVINGLKYDTKTAEAVGDADNPYGRGDFQWCAETLYKTKSDRFFLSGEGGPMSKYAQSCGGNSWCGGDGIIPLDSKEALSWCERNGVGADVIEKHFAIEEA